MCISRSEMTEKYYDMVYRLALSRTKSRTHAEDVSQEVFLRFLKTDKVFENEEHIKAWLIKVTINRSKSVFSDLWLKRTVPLDEEIPFSSPELSEVYFAVLNLPPKYKTALHLFYYEDMSVKSIAECLGEKEATVKTLLHRGRKMLKKTLDGRYDDEL
ncbi:MAG: sigma-70 family RNA polymerase sigma factor [Ruminococcaceae bacterium]|nr:sigma-70 family RNA polymerase sigma factor [Oscillospiraceae bacterium]